MLPKITPLSVEDTLIFALIFLKSCGANVCDCGRSTTFKSPCVESSTFKFYFFLYSKHVNDKNIPVYVPGICMYIDTVERERETRHKQRDRHLTCNVVSVWLMTNISSTMSYSCTVTTASAYTGSERPVSCFTFFRRDEKSDCWFALTIFNAYV